METLVERCAGLDVHKDPASISQSMLTRPRCRKGTWPTGLVASTTRRPPARRSSVIWQPDWALPTTSTAPSGSWSGPR